jgi:hypothetical protein
MNKQQLKTTRPPLGASVWKTTMLLAVSASLAFIFWIASLPMVRAAALTPAEMLKANLPHTQSLVSAPKADVLSAICKAVSNNQKEAPDIVRTAAGVRKELAEDILKTAVNCLNGNKREFNCTLARATLQEAIAANGDRANSLTELFIQLSPTCVESPTEGPDSNLPNVNNVTGPAGSGAASNGNTCAVCHNNHSIQVACSNLENYLKKHPGDHAGACEATPNENR